MTTSQHEALAFVGVLAVLIGVLLGESLVGGKILSPGDVVYVQASFRDLQPGDIEPANRQLMDPVLQFQPWLEFNRAELRRGRLPLWNSLAGCGTPHLANGQSALFDPVHLIAYIGTLPDAHAWMAGVRLMIAGLGMFLLARSWRLGPWGRWFAGLCFPLSGFLVVWLLFPVTGTAVWLPWLFLATDAVLDRPTSRRAGALALVVGATMLGGHVQTSAHMLIASGLYVVWRLWRSFRQPHDGAEAPGRIHGRSLPLWLAGVMLGVALAAVQIVPLGVYLTKSPVWTDRAATKPSVFELSRPRLLDSACTALPYLYGSQRRGQPNLAKALGVHNLNESAGGFAGLATLLWLAPAAWASRRPQPRVRFLTSLVVVGALGAFEVPPVANLLRALPVLDVMDHRRLTLWVAFGLVLLGGIGLDAMHVGGRRWTRWTALWVAAALGLIIVAGLVGQFEPALRARATDHYARAAAETPGADAAVLHARAVRQVRSALDFVPRYAVLSAAQLLAMAAIATALGRGRLGAGPARALLFALVIGDLFAFGHGLNPAIARLDDRPESALIAYLRREAPPPARVLAVGAELPPNMLMRYGLADLRNYDSVELAGNLAHFDALYEPGDGPSTARTSRRSITWAGVARTRDLLRTASVAAVVGESPPPDGLFDRVDRVGAVWVGRLDRPEARGIARVVRRDHGRIDLKIAPGHRGPVMVAESFDPGWRAMLDGRPAAVFPADGTYLGVEIQSDSDVLSFRFDPPEVRLGAMASLAAALGIGVALAGLPRGSRRRKNGNGSWKAARDRVTIDPDDLLRALVTGFVVRRIRR